MRVLARGTALVLLLACGYCAIGAMGAPSGGGVIGAQVTPGAEPIKGSQGNVTGGGSSSATIMTDPWVDSELSNLFNRDDKTFAVGDTIVFNDKVKDLESCALKCNLNDYCEMFAFCADAAGCSVSGMMCGAGATVESGTCVLSMYTAVKSNDGKISDNVNGTAMLGATGPKVGFVSGYYYVDTDPGLPFLEVPLAVDATFNIDRHTFYALPAGIGAATTSKAANVSECASACYANSTCDAFVYCPADKAEGCAVAGYSCSEPTTAAAGDCLLQGDVNSEQTAYLKIDSSLLATISGIRKAVPDDLPAAAPAPAKAA
ncbi:hypothetical protein COHA_003802 [Chlorella ohadii]|uniref:Apple domain-containing protein n=1 Tax=Chlorella ohadii TaxID=2649997 RepID=A0AAD5DUM0_9CHLO|nr:hypothetical protein COHA_003802 [Chlorella ohadii]